jgi:hypothetical protein
MRFHKLGRWRFPLDRGLVMSKTVGPCHLGIHLTTYAELEKIVGAFACGDLNLLILLGGPGLGKSRVVRQATVGQACWLEGNTSPFGLYCEEGPDWSRPDSPARTSGADGALGLARTAPAVERNARHCNIAARPRRYFNLSRS